MPTDLVAGARHIKGLANYHTGLAAEDSVAVACEAKGISVLERRWRGKAGEIDLIGRDGRGFVFVEVKKARTFDLAAERLTMRQLSRICLAAEEYIAATPDCASAVSRVDLALVDGQGRVQFLENVSQY